MERRFWNARIGIGVLVLAAALAVVATRVDFLQGDAPMGSTRNDPAPEFTGLAGWLNSPPLTLAALRGKVVLVDFWAYSCVNCVRTFPALRQMYARYRAFGLEIVGMHAPEFDFEKRIVNVREAIDRNALPWPVALDNDMETWRAYQNHYWPHVYLIDARGKLRFDHIGEGGDELIQDHVRELLEENGATLPEPIAFEDATFNPHQTPEIYAGYLRGAPAGSLGNAGGFRQDVVADYKPVSAAAIGAAGTDGAFFLEGKWRSTKEYVEAAEDGARIVLPFFAGDVFFVAAPGTSSPAGVRVLLDGKAVPPAMLGSDAPNGVVTVNRSDLYRVIALKDAGVHSLTLEVGKGFRLFTFTFG